MPDYSSKQLIKMLEKNGFELHRTKGSHHILKHQNGKRVVVPILKRTYPKEPFMLF